MNVFREFDTILAGTYSTSIIASKNIRKNSARRAIFASAYKTKALVSSCQRTILNKMRKAGIRAVFASEKSEFARDANGHTAFFTGKFEPGAVYDLDEIGDFLGVNFGGSRPRGIKASPDKKNIVIFEVFNRTSKGASNVLDESLDEAETIYDDWYDSNEDIYYHSGVGKQEEGDIYANPDNATYQDIYNAKKNKSNIFVFASVETVLGLTDKEVKNKYSKKKVSYKAYKTGKLYMYIGQVIPITTRADFDNEGSRYNGKLQFRYKPQDRASFAKNYTEMLNSNEKLQSFKEGTKAARDEAAGAIDTETAMDIASDLWLDLTSLARAERTREQNADYDGRVYYPKVEKHGEYISLDSSQYDINSLASAIKHGKLNKIKSRINALKRQNGMS